MKITEKIKAKFRKNEEEQNMKVKLNWSLRKKLLVGAGVLGTAALGIIAYGKSKQEDDVEYNNEFEDQDEDEDEDSEDEDLDGEEVGTEKDS